MANLLYLVHRLPYPPNKGDKVRSYHLLKHLAARHRVFLGTFIDDPDDEVHLDRLQLLCADLHVARLNPTQARLRSLAGLLHGEALSLRYYRDAGLLAWVERLRAAGTIDAVVVFSSAMTPYAEGFDGRPLLVDFVDVDSAKWNQFAPQHRWPMSWVYRREGQCLLEHERTVARHASRSFFVTEKETALFQRLAPECATAVETMNNGVDADFFSPDPERPSPFDAGSMPIVFTGAMDYWPNIDAVGWFAREVLPALRQRWPRAMLHIVGRSPAPAVQALAGEAVVVSGTVPDVRPYLQHASVVVAPLRVARGIQNKILEAMAMGRPVVASHPCVESLDAQAGRGLLAATTPQEYVERIGELLNRPPLAQVLGDAGRAAVLHHYGWSAHLAVIDRHLGVPDPAPAAPEPAHVP